MTEATVAEAGRARQSTYAGRGPFRPSGRCRRAPPSLPPPQAPNKPANPQANAAATAMALSPPPPALTLRCPRPQLAATEDMKARLDTCPLRGSYKR